MKVGHPVRQNDLPVTGCHVVVQNTKRKWKHCVCGESFNKIDLNRIFETKYLSFQSVHQNSAVEKDTALLLAPFTNKISET